MSQTAPALQTERSSAEPSFSARWWLVGLLMALCFISHMNRVSMTIAADEHIMADYGITPVKMGFVYSSFLLIYTIFMIPGGMFLDFIGARRALAGMAFGTAIFGALTGLGAFVAGTHLWLWLMIVRGNMGILTTPLHPGCARAVGLWIIGPRQTFANGLVTGAALLGIACTPLFFGALIDLAGWPIAFVITGGCTAALAVIWLAATHRLEIVPIPDTTVTRHNNWSDLLRSRSLWLLTLSYAAIGYFQYLFFYWMHYYFDHVLKWGTQESRNAVAAPVFAMALTMPLGGWLSQRFEARYGWRAGRVFLASAGMLGAVVFLVIGVMADSWKVAWFTLALGSLGLSEAAFWQTAVELGGKRGGTAAAVMNTGGNGIGLLAPIVTPWVAGQHGWQAGIALGAVVCLLGAVCWLWIYPPQAKNEAEIV